MLSQEYVVHGKRTPLIGIRAAAVSAEIEGMDLKQQEALMQRARDRWAGVKMGRDMERSGLFFADVPSGIAVILKNGIEQAGRRGEKIIRNWLEGIKTLRTKKQRAEFLESLIPGGRRGAVTAKSEACGFCDVAHYIRAMKGKKLPY